MTLIEAVSDYETLAPYYDAFTAHPAYSGWIRRVEGLAAQQGLVGKTALDAACGTGNSSLPLIELGYQVTGADRSPAMLAVARRKLAGCPLFASDIADLPQLGQFALVTWLNDACNCQLHGDSLRRAIASLSRNMAPGGILAFDANTTATYSGFFAEKHIRTSDELEFVWEGQTLAATEGCVGHGVIRVYRRPRNGEPPLAEAPQSQRHHPHALLLAALRDAGLELVACHGQDADGALSPVPRTEQPKWLYVARKPPTTPPERRDDAQGQASGEAGDAGALVHEARLSDLGAWARHAPTL